MRNVGWVWLVGCWLLACGDDAHPKAIDAGNDASSHLDSGIDAGPDAAPDADTDASARFALRPPLGIAMNACGPDLPSDQVGGELARVGALGADFYHLRAQWNDVDSDMSFRDLIKWAPGFIDRKSVV
jgi:hypothetical protein